MSRLVRIVRQRLRSLFRKERLDSEVDQELAFHLEQLERENLEVGMSPLDARRAARLAMGNAAVFKDQCRDERGVTWYYDFRQDVLYGLRMMRRHPGFTAIAAVALALGIGGNAAILNAGLAVVLDDLPLPDAQRLVVFIAEPANNPTQGGPASVPEYVAWKERSHSFESIGASIITEQNLPEDANGLPAERVSGHAVTPSLLQTLQVQPQIGRLFLDEEIRRGAASIIILSHRLWQRRFAGDPDIIGKQIQLNGKDLTVIGVMPRGFWYPNTRSEFWVPLLFTRFQLEASARLFLVAGRLKPQVTVSDAQADMNRVSEQLAQDFPRRHKGWQARVLPLRDHWFGWLLQPLLSLEVGLILVLLITCANVSTLLLARVPARQPEIAIRVLLGAGRGRIVRQFLTESLLLSLIGGALGILIAWWGAASLESLPAPPGRMAIASISHHARIPGIAALLSLLSVLLFGLLPALVAFSSGNDVQQATAHRRRGTLSAALVSIQVGLAFVLLIVSGLLLNSFVRLLLDDRGFNPEGIVTFQYRIPIADYLKRLGSYHGMPSMGIEPPTESLQRVYENLKTLPGIESVAGSSAVPVNAIVPPTATVLAERKAPASVFYFLVTDNFFETMKTPVLRGRDFTANDTRSAPWVAVINETMANRLWPGEDPLGKHFTIDAVSGERPRQVVGVVRDVALQYIRVGPAQPVAYTSYLQQSERYEGFNANMFGQLTFFLRSAQNPSNLESAVRQAVAEVDPVRPLANFQTLTEFVGDGVRARRYYTSALGVFAFMATVLAAIGVYGVMSSSVSQRTREIGIRMAMGAGARDIVRLVGARAFRSVATGLVAGLALSLVLTRLLENQLWGVTPTDLATFAAVIVFLAGVSLTACWIPARRAMRVDPAEALRVD